MTSQLEKPQLEKQNADQQIPLTALVLGMAGVLPFAAAALQIATGWPLGPRMTGPALFHIGAYGACILSFMGGVQWGLVTAQANGATAPLRFVVSIVPALAAWLALYIGARNGLLLLAAGFVALLVYDLTTVASGGAPAWYGRLRLGLTTAVVIALLAAALLGPF